MAQTQAEITTQLIQELEDGGYTVRPSKTCLKSRHWHTKSPDWNATNNARGVKLSIWQHEYSGYHRVRFQVKLRSEIGTYKVHARGSIVPNRGFKSSVSGPWYCEFVPVQDRGSKPISYDELISRLSELHGEEPTKKFRKKADLEPLGFEGDVLTSAVRGIISIRHFIKECQCVDIVAINEKLQVSQEGIGEPNSECWFMIEGRDNASERTVADYPFQIGDRENYNFCIIVNSDITGFHRVTQRNTKRYKGWQVTDNHKPDNGKLDFTAFTKLDKDAIQLAIQYFLSQR